MNITKRSQGFAIFMIAWFPISILYLHATGDRGDLFLAFCLFVILWVLGQERDQIKKKRGRKWIRIENLLFSFFLFFIYRIITVICLYAFHVQANPTYYEDTAQVPMIVQYIIAIIAGPLWEEFIFRKCLWNELKSFGLVCTVIVTSVAFMLPHDSINRIHAFGDGIILGIILIITNDFKMCFFYHAFNNTDAFLFIKDEASTEFDVQKSIAWSLAGAVIAAVLILANKNYRTALNSTFPTS